MKIVKCCKLHRRGAISLNKQIPLNSFFIIFCLAIVLVVFCIWENNYVVITNYTYVNSKIPEEFNNYKILHISDLHNKNYHGRLLNKIRKINPDVIVITGDLIDRRRTKIDVAVELAEQVVRIAPTYYVSGNHEQLSGEYSVLKKRLKQANINIIDNSYALLNKGEIEIGLLGIADPTIQQSERDYLFQDNSKYMKRAIEEVSKGVNTSFNILLSHRPEQFQSYKDMGVDLVFSGHAHGGQVRLPFLGGLYAPNQGMLPKYTEGIYKKGATSMVVSRGLGNSSFPLRVFNQPELVVVTLEKESNSQ